MDSKKVPNFDTVDRRNLERSEDDRALLISEKGSDQNRSSLGKQPISSPVAECIRASFLADIENANSIYDHLSLPPGENGIMQSTSMVKTWSTPEKTVVQGQPPGPDVTAAETARAQVLRQDVRVVTPMYKTDTTTVANGELRSGLEVHREAKVETRRLMTDPDYKIQREQEHYRLQIIDPKVEAQPHVPSFTLPPRKGKTPDFPSAHSKRSFTKLDPLEQRKTRVKSVEDQLRLPEPVVVQPLTKPPLPPPREELRPKIEPPPQIGPKKDLDDLADLAKRRQELLDRAKHRSAINIHELRKVEAEIPPIPTRERYRELLEEAACFETYAAVANGVINHHDQHQQQHIVSENGKSSTSELTRSHSLSTTEFEYTPRQPKSLSQTNLASWKFSDAAFSPRSVISINGGDMRDQLRIRTDLSPAPTRQVVLKSNAAVQTQVAEPQPQPQFWPAVLVPVGTPTSTTTREYKEETKRSHEVERYSSLNDFDEDSRQGTLIRIEDERRPKSIMKPQQRKDEKQLMVKEWDVTERQVNGGGEVVRQVAPKVTETVSTVEEVKRTEEVERRVRESKGNKRSSKRKSGGGSSRHRESRHHRSSGGGQRQPDPDYPWTTPFGESPNAIWRQQQAITANGHGGGQQVTESYHRSGGGGSSSEVRHRNGHQRNSGRRNRVHKSQSSREVYHNDIPEDYQDVRTGRGPIIEYPPTLPRDQNGQPIRVARNGDVASDIGVHKSRSYHDWDREHRGKDSTLARKWDADTSGLEREFRDSLLMPMPGPGQNVNQREYREEEIPGGRETYSREVNSTSGSRPGNTRFSEAKQEMNYRREQASDRRPY